MSAELESDSDAPWWASDDDGDDGYDDSEIRSRPHPKGNRPRTKIRPRYEGATIGRVLGVDRGRYTLTITDSQQTERNVTAARARELRRTPIVTGDRVAVVGDVSGDEGSLARIVRIEERTTLLRRSADDSDTVERAMVANADQMLIVVAAANPEPRTRLVDRYLVAAYDAGITPLLCVTKTDLADPRPFLANFTGLDLPIVTSRHDDMPRDAITDRLIGHETVLVGHSGVGKSTLVNALVPGADRATGAVNTVTGRGRHTSSSTLSLRVRTSHGAGWVIDTPGVRSFGLGHIDPENILDAFPDLARLAKECPRGCTHQSDAADCALTIAETSGELGAVEAARLDSVRRMFSSLGR